LKKVENPSFDKGNYYVYLGRLTKVKGIETLCKAASELPYKLVVIGGGEMEPELRSKYGNTNIEFLGQQKWEEFRAVLEGARFMVIPSEWSENNPLTVIESLALGTPVLGANIGGIPELIDAGVSGMVFESGDQEDLKNKIEKMWNASFDYESISMAAQSRYSSDKYVEQIVDIYNI
jgi:glycosyltransferase involved in cell wall biosynthesis